MKVHGPYNHFLNEIRTTDARKNFLLIILIQSYHGDNLSEIATVSSKRSLFTRRDYLWMAATFTLTPIVAALLSLGGYIPFDVFTAGISGFLVSLVYVGFRVANVYRVVSIRPNST